MSIPPKGHRPKKKWGQNFLRNPGAVDRIVAAVDGPAGELILEIGPGEGALTTRLAALGRPVLAVEIDPDLARRLTAHFKDSEVEIVNADMTDHPLPEVSFRAVGNLPYNVATPIIRRVISSPRFRRAVFMVQKEVADRLTAGPGGEDYGYLSVYAALFARTSTLLTLEPGSFHPRPKVRSAVVVFDPVERELRSDRELLLDLVSAAFRMPRKTLVNNLTGFRGLDRQAVNAAVESEKLGPMIRAEQVSLEGFDSLAAAIGRRLESGR